MVNKIKEMFELQNQFNVSVYPDWLDKKFSWNTAMVVEAAELIDHYGYKWWKKQEPDIEQVKLEIIDLWHFLMSQIIVSEYNNFCKNHSVDAYDINETIDHVSEIFHVAYYTQGLGNDHTLSHRNVKEYTLKFMKSVLDDETSTRNVSALTITSFIRVMSCLGIDIDELYSLYICKNVLNMFRQNNGYKDGSYKKIWNNKEDNVVLMEIFNDLVNQPERINDGCNSTFDALYQELTKVYQNL